MTEVVPGEATGQLSSLYRYLMSPTVRFPLIVLLTVGIFVSDTLTDLEIATAVFYTIVILLAVGRFQSRTIFCIAAGCILLTLVSFSLTKSGSREAGVVNLAISISTIAITTYLALKVVAAEGAAHEARAQLIRLARVNSLGELAASIAHEVNQPLAAIATSGDAALRWLAQTPPNLERAQRAIGRVVEDANRASTIIGRVREHVKGNAPDRRALGIDDIVVEAIALSQGEIDRNGIALHVALAEELPAIWGDKVQLQQVICNLILNAIEAMANMPVHRRGLSVSVVSDAAGDMEVAVSDTGPGIKKEHLSCLFDAFWTTKQGGTGIGLTISRSIVEAHGGAIWVDRMKPQGVCFHIRLPAYHPSVDV
ncbi:MAG TPA: ATP-binding protein [Sphingobium sp.]|uniref:sensor histidine kinase n=1 Tax=Sphingobium sp. TaxID=1912891 RepID=UPI002ED226DE